MKNIITTTTMATATAPASAATTFYYYCCSLLLEYKREYMKVFNISLNFTNISEGPRTLSYSLMKAKSKKLLRKYVCSVD